MNYPREMDNRSRPLDCLLVNPPDDFSRYPYLGLSLLAAVLQTHGIGVEILDSTAVGYGMGDIQTHIRKRNPRIVGISIMSMMLRYCFRLIGQIRRRFPDTMVVVGGAHIDADPDIMKEMPAHYGFRGECEHQFAAFCREVLDGKTPSMRPGMVRRQNGRIVVEALPPEQDLDRLPMPAYEILPLEKYFSPSTSRRAVSFISSRGCPYNCAFCSKVQKTRYRSLNVETTVEQLSLLVHKHRIRWIEFVDEIFTLKRERVLELCDRINTQGLDFSWGMATRIDALDEGIVKAVKRAGCRKISFGIESGVDRVRFAAHKRIRNRQIVETLSMCRKQGLKTMGDFIFGHPTETLEDMARTIAFAKTCGLNYAYFSRMIPIPNSEIFETAKAQGDLSEDVWCAFMRGDIPFPVFTPKGIDPEAVHRLYRKAWYAMYFWPPTLWRNRSVLLNPLRIFQTGRAWIKSVSDKRYGK